MQQDNRTIKERLADFLSYKDIGQDKFAQIANLSRGFANNVGDSIRSSSLAKISVAFPELNTLWLTSGVGDMLTIGNGDMPTTRIIDNEEELREAINKGIKLLPEVDFKFAAGQIELINGTESVKRYWYLPDCRDCEAIAQIAGNSMSPVYPSGCWVALKRHGFSSETATQIPFGNVFGIVIQDKFTGEYHGHIKILRRYKESDLSRKFWIAHSINDDDFDDFDIEIAQVRGLWVVKQHIVSDMIL